MTKPLGFFVAVAPSHPDYPILAELESKYGSFFQDMGKSDIRALLTFCAINTEKESLEYVSTSPSEEFMINMGWGILENTARRIRLVRSFSLIKKLTPKTQFNLIPFLHQLIQEES